MFGLQGLGLKVSGLQGLRLVGFGLSLLPAGEAVLSEGKNWHSAFKPTPRV